MSYNSQTSNKEGLTTATSFSTHPLKNEGSINSYIGLSSVESNHEIIGVVSKALYAQTNQL